MPAVRPEPSAAITPKLALPLVRAGAVMDSILLQLTATTAAAARTSVARWRFFMDLLWLPAVGETQPGRAGEGLVLALVAVAVHAVRLAVLNEQRKLVEI